MTVPTVSTPAAVPRTLTARVSAGSSLRTATYLQDTFIITDVIAMVGDSVIRPLGSRGPEYVPAYVLAAAPQGWNNRPCTLDHPASGTQSANDPTTLERYCFGHVFNARFEDGKLKLEAWLSRARAEAVGPEAIRFIERVEAGEMAEVSIGAYVGVQKQAGMAPNGQEFEYVWTDLAASDHLAMLPEGAIGACSVNGHGCGTNRTARQLQEDLMSKKASNVRPDEAVKPPAPTGPPPSPIGRALSLLRTYFGDTRQAAEQEGLSDSELRGRLWDALYATEPAFGGIVDIYPDSSVVIYTTSPEGNYSWWRRSFAVGDGAAVSLNDDREEVKPVMTYETVAASDGSETAAEPRASCACQHTLPTPPPNRVFVNDVEVIPTGEGQAAPSPNLTNNEGEPMSVLSEKKKALIGRLTANQRVPIPEATLQTLSEEQLEEMATRYEAEPVQPAEPAEQPHTSPPAQPVNASGTVPPRTVTIPEEDFQAMRRAAAAFQAQEQARKTALVGQLKTAQRGFTEAELAAMPIETLEKLALNAGIDRPLMPDYSGRGLAVGATPADADRDVYYNPPDPWGLDKATANGGAN